MNRSTITFWLLGLKHGFDMNGMVKFVMENQYWSQDQITDYQTRRMRLMIAHAYANTLFYRWVMDERGLTPADFRDLSDLKKLPTIGKQEINPCWDDLISVNSGQYKPMHRVTSGTTGVTFQYYNDVKSWGLNWATKIRTFSWGGYRFGADRIATLKGGSMLARGKPSLKSKIWKCLHNYLDLPVVHLSPEGMESYHQLMIKERIRFLRGFPSAVFTFAKYIDEQHGGLPLDATFTSAELLHGYQREQIEKT
ncbi:MAG: phenylacetate--CoA ligase family protein, partial [Candidatus Cloacimonetes bacterium]|nr:phenylacetate--CoA ligase family protein [Candidatus Cloacimonadota bacterium]